MIKRLKLLLLICILAVSFLFFPVSAKADNEEDDFTLYARAAVLIDADSGRILYGKNENEAMPMASTTKIMTLIIALEYGDMDEIVTFSKYASIQPDVQMNAAVGEQYYLKDLLYTMMLKSYNDVAVAIAEHIGEKAGGTIPCAEAIVKRSTSESNSYIGVFADLMNEKAKELGCINTYFITPNGLDAQDSNGVHQTTAYELALISAEAVKNEQVTKITTTRSYSFSELNGKRNVSVATTDRFLDMMQGAVGLKTGFTGDAGYCFAGAVKQEGRTFVSVVLASGWPPNKSYKWTDTKKLMSYGIKNYFPETIFTYTDSYKLLPVKDGTVKYTDTSIPYKLELMLCKDDEIRIVYELPEYVEAPVRKGDKVGRTVIYINDEEYTDFPIYAENSVKKKDFLWCLKKVLDFLGI